MRKLEEENKTLKAILNSLSEGVAVMDKDGKFLFMNPVAKQILGMGPINVIPEKISSTYGIYHLDKVTPYSPDKLPLLLAIKGEEIKNKVIFIRNREQPNGVFIDVSASPLKDQNGAIEGGTIIFRDITKRTIAEEELRKLSNAIDQTADSVLITDTNGVIEYVNPAFETTTGYKCEEVIGQTPRIFKSGKRDSKFYENLWDTIKKGKTFHARIINKKKNNETFWADQTITPMKDNDGNITNYVSVLRDITENVEKQKQELRLKISEEKNKKFEEMDQMKSRFFANISHEFRSPLTLILGPAEKINRDSSGEEIEKQTGVIKRNANRLLGLINQLLDLSKLEAGKMELKASKGNIVSFIKAITMSFESIAEGKDITLKVKASNNEIEMYFDKENMIKIMTNLLSNAFKFTQQGGMITVSIAEMENNFVGITVRDTGLGLSEEEVPKVFDRFYQVESSNTREYGGTGIGLALTKELVELHDGTISVESKLGDPDKGWAEFTVRLPLGRRHLKDDEIVESGEPLIADIMVYKEEYFPAIVEEAGESDLKSENKNIVLVVEDNTDVREYIKDSLGDDFQIKEAENGEQGVRKAKQIIPDLIISDIIMPKMDGTKLTRILKNDEKTSHIPIILLTSKAGQESKIEGLETGADAFLTKPFDTKELLVQIKNLLSIRKKLQEKYSKEILVQKMGGKKLSDLDEKFMNKVLNIVDIHMSEENFSIEDFDSKLGMGRVQIYRKLKALTGKSPSRYIRSIRLVSAKKIIETKKGNISEAAFSVGFGSPAYFTKCFNEEFGFPPSDLIKN